MHQPERSAKESRRETSPQDPFRPWLEEAVDADPPRAAEEVELLWALLLSLLIQPQLWPWQVRQVKENFSGTSFSPTAGLNEFQTSPMAAPHGL